MTANLFGERFTGALFGKRAKEKVLAYNAVSRATVKASK